jgi:glycosyltransferase involved in cell wall biosynthesis
LQELPPSKLKQTKPLVSVLLPFYKVEGEFDLAIQSICNQTFSRWELVLVSNNGNTTGKEIAKKWEAKDKRVKVVYEPQQGIAFALNTGLKHCTAPYIARMDADDISHPDRLEKQVNFLDRNPEIDVVSAQTSFASDCDSSEGFSIFVDWQNSIVTAEDHHVKRFIESPLAHPTIMFRRELIDNFGGYDTGPVPEDYELWLRWMDKGVRFYKIPEKLLVWQDHPARLTRTHENYSREAFYQVKCKYLASWINRTIPNNKKILICGSSRIGRKRATMLEEFGVNVFGFTDAKKRPNRQVNFVCIKEITNPKEWFLVNFIARRGVGQAIKDHFSKLGFVEAKDFILAG